MKNNTTLKTGLLSLAFFAFAAFFNPLQAQHTESNQIAAVNVSSNDGFNELRALLVDQFDFTNPDMQQGEVKTDLKFTVNKDGSIANVQAVGGCKYVEAELENVLSHLHYRLNTDKIRVDTQNTSFVMPVNVMIASR